MPLTKSIVFLTLLLFFSSIYAAKIKSELKLNTRTFLQEMITQSEAGVFCYLNSNGTVYDLRPLTNTQKDYQIIQGNSSQVDFNICKNANKRCGDNKGMVTWSNIQDAKDCKVLAGLETVASKWSLLSDSKTKEQALQIELPAGDVCKTNSTLNYQTTLMYECDSKAIKRPLILTDKIDIDQCTNIIKIKSAFACPLLHIYSFWNTITGNKNLIGTAMIMTGFFYLLFGIKFIFITEVGIGIMATSSVLMYVLFSYLHIQYTEMEFWLITIICLLSGIILGYGLIKFKKVPVVVLAVGCGYILAIFTFHLFLKYIKYYPYAIFWLTAGSLAIGFGVLAWAFYEHVLVIGTSFVGAYAIIRGMALINGGFPDERQVMDLINFAEWDQLNELFTFKVYLYLAAIAIVGFAGAYIQYEIFYKESNFDPKLEASLTFKDPNATQMTERDRDVDASQSLIVEKDKDKKEL